jgi:hypothetical protein
MENIEHRTPNAEHPELGGKGDRMAHLVGGILHVPFAVCGYIRGIKPDCLTMAHKGFIAGLVLLVACVLSA